MKPHLNNEYKNQQVKRAGLDTSYVLPLSSWCWHLPGQLRFIESPEFALVCWVIRPTRTDIECLVDWHICFLPMSALLDPPIVEVTCWLPALISGFRFVLSILASVTPSALKYLFHYSRAYQPTHQPTSDKHFASLLN